MSAFRPYKHIINMIIMAVLFAISLNSLLTSESSLMFWVSFVCMSIFGILIIDSVRLVRKRFFNIHSKRKFGMPVYKSFNSGIKAVLTGKHNHPILVDHTSAYYEVHLMDGSIEYVERMELYKWLVRVYKFQTSPSRKPQESPLAIRKWEQELGGAHRYYAYMYILESVKAIDPESSYHVKLLRTTPWNVVLAADELMEVRIL